MNISGINPNLNIPATNSAPAGSGSGTELRSLEQKLAQLQKEKKEAVENKDIDKAKALEKEIQNVKRQIRQLKEKENKAEETQAAKKQENGQEQPAQLVSEQMLNRLA